MKKLLALAAFLASLLIGAPAYGQQVNLYCNLGTGGLNPWQPCSTANPLAVAATITPSGTQNVNLTQILSAAPSATNPLWVAPATASTPWASNITQVNGVALLAGNGATGTGSPRVTLSNDNTIPTGWPTAANQIIASGATAAAVPANAVYQGVNVGGNTVGIVGDPCQTVARTRTPISITTNTTTVIITGAASKKTYICHLFLTSAAADNVAIVEDATGTTCVSPEAGLIGGVTAANGMNFAANGGVSLGNGGYAIAQTATNQNDVCLITSVATPLAGVVTWVQQ